MPFEFSMQATYKPSPISCPATMHAAEGIEKENAHERGWEGIKENLMFHA